MRTFKATRWIVQEATIKAESVAEASNMVHRGEVGWSDTSKIFRVFDNLEDEEEFKRRTDSGPPPHFQQ